MHAEAAIESPSWQCQDRVRLGPSKHPSVPISFYYSSNVGVQIFYYIFRTISHTET